jgi:hypothetical protein
MYDRRPPSKVGGLSFGLNDQRAKPQSPKHVPPVMLPDSRALLVIFRMRKILSNKIVHKKNTPKVTIQAGK